MGDHSSASGFCPYCQMPLTLVRNNNLNLHVEVCYRKTQKTGWQTKKECPKGVNCISSMICHYDRYSHHKLAKARAKGCDEKLQIGSPEKIPSLSQNTLPDDSDSSMDDFENLLPISKAKKKRKTFMKKRISSITQVKSRSPKQRLTSQTNLQSKLITDENHNKSSSSNKWNDKTAHIHKSDSMPKILQVESIADKFCQSMDNESQQTDDCIDWPIFSPRGAGFIPKTQMKLDSEQTEGSEAFSINIERIPASLHNSQDLSFDASEVPFDNLKPNAMSTQMPQFVCTSESDTDSDSLLKSFSINASQLNLSSQLKPQASPKIACLSPPKKQKQADIGSMLFGMKPKQNCKPSIVDAKTVEASYIPIYNKKQCPFYKKVQGTNIAVDAFSYGLIPGITFYVLSHFHYDHYMGLSKKFEADIYCSHVTGNLVESRLRLPSSQIKRLPLNKSISIGKVKVTLLEANHCPGAVLMLFKLSNGRTILHTGDFRADQDLRNNPILYESHIYCLYLDTTYLDPNYDFPPQDDVVEFISKEIAKVVRSNCRTLVVTGTYCIGKEKIFLGIADQLGCDVFVSADKYKTLTCLDDEKVKKILTRDPKQSNLHVLPMKNLEIKSLNNYLQKFREKYEQIVAVKPTGWTYKGKSTDLNCLKPSRYGSVIIYGVPYSEHSSFLELKQFVEALKPDKIIPTVNVGKPETRNLMESYLNQWKRK